MKQTFEIPDGCNRVTIEQQGNKIVTAFEPGFKEGDIIYVTCSKIFIVKDFEKGSFHAYLNTNYDNIVLNDFFCPRFGGFECRIASPDEINKIRQSLCKIGKIWNAEKKCIEDLKPKRWRAEYGHCYWHFDHLFRAVEDVEQGTAFDLARYNCGNYFNTESETNLAGLKTKELLKQINP